MPSFQAFPELPDWFWYPITFMYGAIVGSFLNVIIYRMPLGLNLNRPPSSCPNCGNKLRFTDNIPLVAFLALRGRCGFCRNPISWRYFSIELLSACLWAALYSRVSGTTGISWVDYVAQALFASLLVAMVFIDLDHFIALDELNVVGFVLGMGRDLVCIALAWFASHGTQGYVWQENAPHFLYMGWLPRFVPGALVYGGALYLVSMAAFLYYARGDKESIPAALNRFFKHLDLQEEPAASEENTNETGGSLVEQSTAEPLVATAPATPEILENSSATPDSGEAGETAGQDSGSGDSGDEDNEEMEGEPPRLRFSPGLLAVFSTLLMLPVIGAWSILFLIFPVAAFVSLSRRPGETTGAAVARFFIPADDDNYSAAPEAHAGQTPDEILAGVDEDAEYESLTPAQRAALAQVEASQFAKEAESGSQGGMGLGDAKLGLAIGAMLGPGMALLSFFIAAAVGSFTGIAVARLNKRNLRYSVPFVPFMAIGAIVTMLYGPAFMSWYQTLFDPNRNAQPIPASVQPLRPRLRQMPPRELPVDPTRSSRPPAGP